MNIICKLIDHKFSETMNVATHNGDSNLRVKICLRPFCGYKLFFDKSMEIKLPKTKTKKTQKEDGIILLSFLYVTFGAWMNGFGTGYWSEMNIVLATGITVLGTSLIWISVFMVSYLYYCKVKKNNRIKKEIVKLNACPSKESE